MPNVVINSVVKNCNYTKEEAEELWEKAEQQAGEQGKKDNHAYVMSIFKNMVGEKCFDNPDSN